MVCDKNKGTCEEEVFTYDAAGSVQTAIDEGPFTYDTNNRLQAYNETNITYDADGNMLTATLGDGCFTYGYDSANRLISVSNLSDPAAQVTYTYDAANTRIKTLRNNVETTYAYDTIARLSRLLIKTTGNDVTKYVYGLGLIGEENSGDFETYHYDYRGSTVAITDECGCISDTFEYDTYGKLIRHTGSSDTPFLYNGRDVVMTESNGLYYMRNRYYCPDLRRFINADIVAGELANSVTMNRYAYANANPAMNVDPLGLSADNWSSDPMKEIFDALRLIRDSNDPDALSKLFSSVLEEVLHIQDLFTFVNDKKFEIKVGSTTFFCSMKTVFGDGFINIEDKASVNMEILNSMSFSKSDSCFSNEKTKDGGIILKFSYDIDDYTSITATISSNLINSLSASYTVTTADSDNNSITTSIGFNHVVTNIPQTTSTGMKPHEAYSVYSTIIVVGLAGIAAVYVLTYVAGELVLVPLDEFLSGMAVNSIATGLPIKAIS